jgi:hypothetical protein
LQLDGEDFLNVVGREDAADAPRTFAPVQLAACEACGRQSPPTRMSCLYCGARLPAPPAGEDLRRPALRPLEDWERGINVVLVGAVAAGDGAASNSARGAAGGSSVAGLSDEAVAEAASLLQIEAEDFRGLASAGVPLPLARTADAEEAALLEQKLGALGFRVEKVADEELAIESHPPRRVRQLALDAEGLTARAAGGGEGRARWHEVELIVAGRIFERRIETDEPQKRGRDEPADSRELTSDEAVVDLYLAGRAGNWRVGSEGFDFSCLGAEKRLLAAENFARLTRLLRERSSAASFDDSYARLRHLLKFAWPPAERAVSAGLRRARPGVLRAGAATVVSNEQQFTRYGRLLRRMSVTAKR